MGETVNVSAKYQFRGNDYLISINVDDENQLTVEVEEKDNANQWRATYDASYIEELTHKTGNFKQFTVFVSMLESAVTQSSDAVSLDLLTYADLESLRNRKAGVHSKVNTGVNRSSTLNSKRYLILTYTVEFDRIHYPLPLPFVGQPEPKKLQETIRNLQQEIKTLKKHGVKDVQHKELEKLRRENDKLLQEKEDLEADFIDYKRQVQNTSKGSAAKEIRILKGIVKNLEEEILSEKTKYQRSSNKLNQEYRQLSDEVEELRASERNLRVRVKSLTNELNVYKRGRGRPNTSTSSRQSYSRDRNSSRNNSLVRSTTSSRENSFNQEDSRLSRENSRISRTSRDSRSSYTRPRSSILQNTSRERSVSRERSLTSRDKPVGRSSSLTRGRSSSREGNATLTRNRSISNDRQRYTRPLSSREKPLLNRDRSLSRERQFSYNDRLRDRSTSRERSYNSRRRSPSPSAAGARNPRFDPSAFIREKERKTKEADLKKKRQIRSTWTSSMDSRIKGPSSRSSSVGSVRSRNSSVESLSDIPGETDASEAKYTSRRNNKVLKPSKMSNSNGWSSPDISFSKPPAPRLKEKILASTPESGKVKTQSRISRKENVKPNGDKYYYDRVDEISEIDARLNRLQEFMKSNLQT